MREGYAVDLADTVADATDKLGYAEYDVALLDITLPDGDGLSLAHRIRTGAVRCLTGPDLRLVMLTARGRLEDRVRGLDVERAPGGLELCAHRASSARNGLLARSAPRLVRPMWPG